VVVALDGDHVVAGGQLGDLRREVDVDRERLVRGAGDFIVRRRRAFDVVSPNLLAVQVGHHAVVDEHVQRKLLELLRIVDFELPPHVDAEVVVHHVIELRPDGRELLGRGAVAEARRSFRPFRVVECDGFPVGGRLGAPFVVGPSRALGQ
jgi:hypothetical protein